MNLERKLANDKALERVGKVLEAMITGDTDNLSADEMALVEAAGNVDLDAFFSGRARCVRGPGR